MPGPRPVKKKISKPVLLSGSKKTAKTSGKKTNTAKPPSARKVAAGYRKKAQSTRLTPRQRAIVAQREKDAAMDRKYEVTKYLFGKGL